MGLNIDYVAVEGQLESIRSTLSGSNASADYSDLLARFSESEGEEATAIRAMLMAERTLAEQLNITLDKFASSIQATVNEFKGLDRGARRAMESSGSGGNSSKGGGKSGASGGGSR